MDTHLSDIDIIPLTVTVLSEGTLHYIMARGIEGGKIFGNDVDREHSPLLEILYAN